MYHLRWQEKGTVYMHLLLDWNARVFDECEPNHRLSMNRCVTSVKKLSVAIFLASVARMIIRHLVIRMVVQMLRRHLPSKCHDMCSLGKSEVLRSYTWFNTSGIYLICGQTDRMYNLLIVMSMAEGLCNIMP